MKSLILSLITLMFAANSLFAQISWVKRYDGQAHNLDYAAAVKILNNKVYAAGSSWGQGTNTDLAIIKYDLKTGAQEWAYRFNAPDSGSDNANSITADSWGYLYITGSVNNGNPSSIDMFTMSITESGGTRWMKEFTGTGYATDQGLKIMTDNNRNVYVMGITTAPAGDFDIIVIKYTGLGNEVWRKQYESPQIQMPKDMYVNKATGEVFVTGYTGNNYTDYITLMINASGSLGWVRTHGGTANEEDVAESIGHNIYTEDLYITGKCQNTGTGVGITTICYKKNGDQRWVSRYDCPVTGGTAIGCDVESIGDLIYVSAYSNESNMSQFMGLVLGIDSSSQLLWKTTYASRTGNFTSQNIPTDMKVSNSGHAYISATGFDSAFGQGNNFMLVSIDHEGFANLQQYNSTFSDFTSAMDISYQGIVVTGSSDTTGHSSDMLTVKFNSFAGTSTSTNRKAIAPFMDVIDTMRAFHTWGNYGDATGIIKVTVTLDSIIFPQDGDLEIYLQHNGVIDTLIYHQGGSGDNFISTELSDSADSPITGGSAPFTGSFRPYHPLSLFSGHQAEGEWILRIKNTGGQSGMLNRWSIRFEVDENTIGISPVSNQIPGKYSLSQNYPNPFNPVTNIKFSIPKSGLITLKVYDIIGREVEQLINQTMNAGIYKYDFDASHLSSGVYFYKLTAGDFTETKKMLLIK